MIFDNTLIVEMFGESHLLQPHVLTIKCVIFPAVWLKNHLLVTQESLQGQLDIEWQCISGKKIFLFVRERGSQRLRYLKAS